MECLQMKQGYGRGFSAAEKTELWDRWQRGESLRAIGRVFGKPSSGLVRGKSLVLAGVLILASLDEKPIPIFQDISLVSDHAAGKVGQNRCKSRHSRKLHHLSIVSFGSQRL
jgi:hypothetical protein